MASARARIRCSPLHQHVPHRVCGGPLSPSAPPRHRPAEVHDVAVPALVRHLHAHVQRHRRVVRRLGEGRCALRRTAARAPQHGHRSTGRGQCGLLAATHHPAGSSEGRQAPGSGRPGGCGRGLSGRGGGEGSGGGGGMWRRGRDVEEGRDVRRGRDVEGEGGMWMWSAPPPQVSARRTRSRCCASARPAAGSARRSARRALPSTSLPKHAQRQTRAQSLLPARTRPEGARGSEGGAVSAGGEGDAWAETAPPRLPRRIRPHPPPCPTLLLPCPTLLLPCPTLLLPCRRRTCTRTAPAGGPRVSATTTQSS